MQLSDLQRYILKQTFIHGPRCDRSVFDAFYRKNRKDEHIKIITRSIERLIAKGELIAHGHKTAEKFFIQTVQLTPKGRRVASQVVRQQQRLPLALAKKHK